MKKIIILGFIFYFQLSFSQPVTFERWFNYGGAESGQCVQETRDGGFIVAGRQGIGIGSSKHLLIKTDSLGNEVWHKAFGSGNSELYSIKQTFDGGYVVTGTTTGSQANHYDVFWAKLDSLGDTLWTKRYMPPPPDYRGEGADVLQTSDSGYIILANILDTNYSSVCLLIKANIMGDTLWTKKFTSAFPGISPCQIKETVDNGFIIVGTIYYGNPIQSDVYLIRTYFNGDTLWTKILYEPHNEGASNLIVLDSGYFIRGNYIYTNPTVSFQYLLKVDSIGDTLWTKKYGNGIESGMGADKKTDNNFIISGATDLNSFTTAGYLMSVDEQGDSLWMKYFPNCNGNLFFVQATRDGGCVATGYRSSPSGDAYLLKTDSLGNVVIAVEEISPGENSMLVYPNPFHESATILLPEKIKDHPSSKEIILELSNVLGKEVTKLTLKPYDDRVLLNRNNLTAGVYILRLYSPGEIIASQVIIMY